MNIEYLRAGDYLLPNIILHENSSLVKPLGKYGMMHKAYLKEHRPMTCSTLLLTERLYPLCREVDEAAAHRLTTIPGWEVAHEVERWGLHGYSIVIELLDEGEYHFIYRWSPEEEEILELANLFIELSGQDAEDLSLGIPFHIS